jgi:hypothetical protein
MRSNYLVPVIAMMLPAGVSLTTLSSLAQTVSQGTAQGTAQAATQSTAQAPSDACLGKPGATAPQGSHWYYRINRSTRRHCWYLGAESARVRTREAATRTASPKPIRQRTAAHSAEPSVAPAVVTEDAPVQETAVQETSMQATSMQATSIQGTAVQVRPVRVTAAQPAPVLAAPLATGTSEVDPGAEFATRWPNLPSSVDLNARKPASSSSSYTEEHAARDAQDDTPPVWPVLTPADRAAAEPATQSNAIWVYILALLSGALALAAMLLRAIGNRAAARRSARSEPGEQRRAMPDVPRPHKSQRPQFADALAAALESDPGANPIAAMRRVDLASPPSKPDAEPREPAEDVEASLQRLLDGWQRVAA